MIMVIIIGVHDYSVNDAITLKFIAIVIGFVCKRFVVCRSHTSRHSFEWWGRNMKMRKKKSPKFFSCFLLNCFFRCFFFPHRLHLAIMRLHGRALKTHSMSDWIMAIINDLLGKIHISHLRHSNTMTFCLNRRSDAVDRRRHVCRTSSQTMALHMWHSVYSMWEMGIIHVRDYVLPQFKSSNVCGAHGVDGESSSVI